jgi:hypothetical protein
MQNNTASRNVKTIISILIVVMGRRRFAKVGFNPIPMTLSTCFRPQRPFRSENLFSRIISIDSNVSISYRAARIYTTTPPSLPATYPKSNEIYNETPISPRHGPNPARIYSQPTPQSPSQLLTPSNPKIVTKLLGTVRTRLTPNPPYNPLAPSSRITVRNASHRPLYFAPCADVPPRWFCRRVRRTSWGYVAPEASDFEIMIARIRECMGNGRGVGWDIAVSAPVAWGGGEDKSGGARACLRYSSAGNWTTTWDTPIKLGNRPE